MISAKALFKINAYNKVSKSRRNLGSALASNAKHTRKTGDTCSEMEQGHRTRALATADLKTGGSH